jgi:hypothetical protein
MKIRNAILVLACVAAGLASRLCGQQSGEYLPAQFSLNATVLPHSVFTDDSRALYYSVGHLNVTKENQLPRPTKPYSINTGGNVLFFGPKDQVLDGDSFAPFILGSVANSFTVAAIAETSGESKVEHPFFRNFKTWNLVWPLRRTDAYAGLDFDRSGDQLTVGMTNNMGPGYSASSTSPAIAEPPADPRGQNQSAAPLPQPLSSDDDGGWHIAVSPYLWLPGVHGTVGVAGKDASFRASPSDLLSHFKFGLLGFVEARHGRILTSLDMMFMRLGDDRAVPFPGLEETTANLTAKIFLLTPKVGIRLINAKKLKADFLTGIRYWYFGESLQFTPFVPFLNFSKSQNWVDPLVGGRIEMGLSRKTVFTLAGDVGGWGTGSQLEYQVAGLLGYKVKRNMTLQGGYRYLYFDYQRSGQAGAVLTTAMSGVVLGVTLNLN